MKLSKVMLEKLHSSYYMLITLYLYESFAKEVLENSNSRILYISKDLFPEIEFLKMSLTSINYSELSFYLSSLYQALEINKSANLRTVFLDLKTLVREGLVTHIKANEYRAMMSKIVTVLESKIKRLYDKKVSLDALKPRRNEKRSLIRLSEMGREFLRFVISVDFTAYLREVFSSVLGQRVRDRVSKELKKFEAVLIF